MEEENMQLKQYLLTSRLPGTLQSRIIGKVCPKHVLE